MKHYVFTNTEKEALAKEAIAKKGQPKGFRADPDGKVRVANCELYNKAITENPKISEEELLLYIYKGLGGRLEEYDTVEKAVDRKTKLQNLRVKQVRKDAA
mgnify:CR=1 FL=1